MPPLGAETFRRAMTRHIPLGGVLVVPCPQNDAWRASDTFQVVSIATGAVAIPHVGIAHCTSFWTPAAQGQWQVPPGSRAEPPHLLHRISQPAPVTHPSPHAAGNGSWRARALPDCATIVANATTSIAAVQYILFITPPVVVICCRGHSPYRPLAISARVGPGNRQGTRQILYRRVIA